ncbi:MAG: cysteate synthase [Chlorobi bacterium]|nr:cysteate synthase [Chlorobiota bacterium]
MALQFSKTKYVLESLKTGKIFHDTGWILDAPEEKEPTLIRAKYEETQINVKGSEYGLYQFADWLPVNRMLKGSSSPVTYKSEGLAERLGLTNLWITFSGYWPGKGAIMKTCSFKETEAYSVCARMNPVMDKILVVASAGNTARAFAQVCSSNNIPLLLCVPEDHINALWFDAPLNDCVKLVCSRLGSDYFDAIHLSNLASELDGFIAEGGAKNVARRDGMGTTVLSAVTTIGKIPEYYFQAVGSGTGAIAAWEANLRFINDGRFGKNKMKLMISQNIPFIPIYDSWRAGSRILLPLKDTLARQQAGQIIAKVLSNRKPPYTVTGGLYDALADTGGDVLTASNEEAVKAAKLFEETEGIDIHPAATVALATLVSEVKANRIDKNALIMLNVTGGGENRFKQEKDLHYLKPSFIFDINPNPIEVEKEINRLF